MGWGFESRRQIRSSSSKGKVIVVPPDWLYSVKVKRVLICSYASETKMVFNTWWVLREYLRNDKWVNNSSKKKFTLICSLGKKERARGRWKGDWMAESEVLKHNTYTKAWLVLIVLETHPQPWLQTSHLRNNPLIREPLVSVVFLLLPLGQTLVVDYACQI